MVVELTKPGDRLIGKRIYAQFREWEPLKEPAILDDNIRNKYTLKVRVSCRIETPLNKKK